jgi:hypothetical protein
MSFDLTTHLARSAEVSAFDLSAHLKPRQPINMLGTTCAVKRRPLSEDRTFKRMLERAGLL